VQQHPPQIVVATEVIASGQLTRRDLNRRYTKLYRNVYVRNGDELTAADLAYAGWLWSGRTATLVGHSAAALLGSRWIPADAPVEVAHSRRTAPSGIVVRSDELRVHDVRTIGGITCTTAARTAYDLGRRLPLEMAVIRIDALLNATSATPCSVEDIARCHHGARGIRRLRTALDLVDAGAESPQETRLRLLLVQSGLPRPVTQIPVKNARGRVVRRIDMGWHEWKVGVEYDGEQHFSNPDDYAKDIERLEFLASKGWAIVRVSAMQLRHQRAEVVQRVRLALRQRGFPD
jgi:very-short-patch-repair endonuclease